MFVHGLTFGGHPMAAAAALANLDIFEREDLCGHVREKEGEFRAMLEALRDIPIVGDVRGAGFFHAIELVKDQETKETFNDEESETLLRGFLSGALYEHGLICRADDRGDPVIQLSPPLIADTEQFEEIERDPAPRCSPRPPDSQMTARRSRLGSRERGHAHGPHPRRRDGPRAGQRRGRRRRARALGAHHRAARPDAVAVGRRADPDHRPAAQERPSASASSRGGWRTTTWPASGFGTGFEHDRLPEALVDEAAHAGLPGVRGALRAAVHRAHREGVRAAGERAVRGAPARDRHPQAARAAGARGARARRAGARAVGRDRRRGAGARRARRARWPSAPSGGRCPPTRSTCLRDADPRPRRRTRADGEAREFAPDHPDLAGRSLVLPVATRGAARRTPGWSPCATPAGSATSSA